MHSLLKKILPPIIYVLSRMPVILIEEFYSKVTLRLF